MGLDDDIAVLTEFRCLLESWEELHADNWHSDEKARRERETRNAIGTHLETVRGLVSAVIVDIRPFVDRRNEDADVDPFDAPFEATWLTHRTRDLVNRAIGVYKSGGPQPAPIGMEPLPDLAFVADAALRGVLEQNVKELYAAYQAKAWTAVIILAGAIGEGVLFSLLNRKQADAQKARTDLNADPQRSQKIKEPNIEDWKLWAYIDVVDEMNCLSGTTRKMAHSVLREFRNMVHPRCQIRDNLRPTPTAAQGSVLYLRSLIKDVAAVP